MAESIDEKNYDIFNDRNAEMLQEELRFIESKTVTKSNNEDAQSRMKLSRSYMGEDRDVQTPNNRSDL